ncbi:MAG: glycosyltransferase family A protein [Actinomycetota bacterium]|nr:glycosyltransferase family A protein [Actinomycetota bacterium]
MRVQLVSCVMVTRDRPELARRAVQCFLDQSWPHRELVILDDGDADYSPMLDSLPLQGHRVRYHRVPSHPNVLLGALRNLSLDLSDGDWCIQWDDDEWYHPDRIAIQMAHHRGVAGVALQWTLVDVQSEDRGRLTFRADTGIATPGTILHRRDVARYPNVSRGEDAAFMRDVRRAGNLQVLGREFSHLFVRRFHGANTWDEQHFLARLRRRPIDVPSYALARWWHHDLRRHRAFRLTASEQASIAALDHELQPSGGQR